MFDKGVKALDGRKNNLFNMMLRSLDNKQEMKSEPYVTSHTQLIQTESWT